MDPEDLILIREILTSEFGQLARIWPCDRTRNPEMDKILSMADKDLPEKYRLYWVANALPEIFILNGFPEPVIAVSQRYIELWADVRACLCQTGFGLEVNTALSERLALRLIAEFSLRYDDPEFAACAILKSTLHTQNIFNARNTFRTLEMEPMCHGYLACMYYGIAHELGHLATAQFMGTYADIHTASLLQAVLLQFNFPSDVAESIIARAREDRDSFLLGTANLRAETHADIFAAGLLHQATVEFLRRDSTGLPDSATFIIEMIVSMNVMAFVDRCRRSAELACTPNPSYDMEYQSALQPVAFGVRMLELRRYLEASPEATPEQSARRRLLIDRAFDALQPAIEAVDRGLRKAHLFSIQRDHRPNFHALMTEWRDAYQSRRPIVEKDEIEQFHALATSLGNQSRMFDQMLEIARDPSRELEFEKEEGSRVFFCIWVEKADGTSLPFFVQSRYGPLVLVFQSPITFHEFRRHSLQFIPVEAQVQNILFEASSLRHLQYAIAVRIPTDMRYQIIIEGSEAFEIAWKEFLQGTTDEAGSGGLGTGQA